MVDPNTRQQMGESDDIINYLYNEYGDGNVPLLLKLGPLTAISNTLALLPRQAWSQLVSRTSSKGPITQLALSNNAPYESHKGKGSSSLCTYAILCVSCRAAFACPTASAA